MRNGYWTDDVAAMAVTTPIDQIRIGEVSSAELHRLLDVIEEMRHDQAEDDQTFEERYWKIRRLLETNERD
jgi:hypothetical protein